MKPASLNRALLVIAMLGVLVAGVLSSSHVLNLTLPCGPSAGCDAVTRHPSGKIADIPIAYFGFATYLAFAALAFARSKVGLAKMQSVTNIATIVAGAAFVYSAYLQYIAFNEIRQTCWWCLASAILMALNFFGTFMLRDMTEPDDAPRSPETLTAGAMAVVAAIGIGAYAVTMQGQAAGTRGGTVNKTVDVIPAQRNLFGDPNAPITIVEFADLQCPACKVMSPRMKLLVNENSGKVNLVFRHWPLQKHRFALPAAIISEYAAEQGKFWVYLEAAMMIPDEPPSAQPFFDAAAAINLDVSEIKKRIGDENDPIFQRVYRDIQASDQLGLRSTPSFIIVKDGEPREVVTGIRIFDVLEGAPYNLTMPAGIKDPPQQPGQ